MKKCFYFIFLLFVVSFFEPSMQQAFAGENLPCYENFTISEGLPENLKKANSNYGYLDMDKRSNSEQRKELYRALEKISNDFFDCDDTLTPEVGTDYAVIGSIDISNMNLSEDEMVEVYYTFRNDNPVFYFLSSTFCYVNNSIILRTEVFDGEERQEIEDSLEIFLEDYEACTKEESIFAVVYAIHNKLVNEMTYSYVFDSVQGKNVPDESYWAHSIEGAVLKGKGVCESYAKTFQMLLQYYGYENIYVVGRAGDENHAWNMVKLEDGLFYYIDVTWDDTSVSSEYFACGNKFEETHSSYKTDGKGKEFLYILPEAADENYIKNLEVYIDGVFLRKCGDMSKVFQLMTEESSTYSIKFLDKTTWYNLPEGEWPKVKMIEFGENDRAYSEYYTMTRLFFCGNNYLNSNVTFCDIQLTVRQEDFFDQLKPTLHARDYTLYFQGKGNFLAGMMVIDSNGESTDYGLSIIGQNASIVSDASDRLELFLADIEIGKMEINNWLLMRGGQITCKELNLSKNVSQVSFDPYYNSKLSLEIAELNVKGQYVDFRGFLLNDDSSFTIGSLNQSAYDERYIFFNFDVYPGKKMPNLKINLINTEINLTLHNYHIEEHSCEEFMQLYNQTGDSRWVTLSIFKEIANAYPSTNEDDLFEYMGSLLNIGSSDIEKVKVTFENFGDVYRVINVTDFLEVDAEGNVARKNDKKVVVKNGVLEKAVFYSLDGIVYTLPKEVLSIKCGMYRGIKELVIPPSLVMIEDGSFYGSSVEKFSLSEDSPFFTLDHDALYTKDMKKIIAYPKKKTDSFSLPEGVTTIAGGALSLESMIDTISFPSTLESFLTLQGSWKKAYVFKAEINDYLFSHSFFLEDLVFEENVQKVGKGFATGCQNLESLTILNPYAIIDNFALERSDCGDEKKKITVYGYIGSTTEEYVTRFGDLYGLEFSAIQKNETPSSESQVTSFVRRLYNLVLYRVAEGDGMETWKNALMDGSWTGSQVAEAFILSPEFINRNLSNEELVDILYKTFLSRNPDETGKETWLQALSEGYCLKYVVNGFANSNEFAGICDTYGISQGLLGLSEADKQKNLSEKDYGVWQFVERLYLEILSRKPDQEGLLTWTEALTSERFSGSEVASGFILSKEFLERDIDNQKFIEIMYRTFFNREADSVGLSTWMNVLSSVGSKQDVFYGFVNSVEFDLLCNSYGIIRGKISN